MQGLKHVAYVGEELQSLEPIRQDRQVAERVRVADDEPTALPRLDEAACLERRDHTLDGRGVHAERHRELTDGR